MTWAGCPLPLRVAVLAGPVSARQVLYRCSRRWPFERGPSAEMAPNSHSYLLYTRWPHG